MTYQLPMTGLGRLGRTCCACIAVLCAAWLTPLCIAADQPERAPIAWLWDGAVAPKWANHVAVVVRHISLAGDAVLERPRATSPALGAGTIVTPVVHVEISTRQPPLNIQKSHDAIVQAVMQAAQHSTSGWVQLDMEARPSQREFYLQLVADLHRLLPAKVKLSVTALAWWCSSHKWLDTLAADEIVPMFFRMGSDTNRLRHTLETNPAALNHICTSHAAGFSTAEPVPDFVKQRYATVYLFDMLRWQQP